MEDNPGFRIFKEAFDRFAAKYPVEDLAGRVVRSVADGGKAAVERGMTEFPKSFINQMAKDLYSLVTSEEVSEGISTTVRSYDAAKVKEMLDSVVGSLKDRDTALSIAKQIKGSLDKMGASDLTAQLEGIVGLIPGGAAAAPYIAIFVKPILDEIKHGTEEEAAEKIMELADSIPTDFLAEQAEAYTREVTPERVSKQAHDLVGRMPSPQAVADIAHGIGEEAVRHLDKVSKVSSIHEVPGILSDFAQNASDVVSDKLAEDKQAKKTFTKKGDSFDL
jgi:hypothetical protein